MKIKLISEWRNAPKMLSVQALAMIGVIASAQAMVPATALELPLPFLGMSLAEALSGITAVLAFFGIFGRLVDQALAAGAQ